MASTTPTNVLSSLLAKVKSLCKAEPSVVVGVLVAALTTILGVTVLPVGVVTLVVTAVAVLGGSVTVRSLVTPANVETLVKDVGTGVTQADPAAAQVVAQVEAVAASPVVEQVVAQAVKADPAAPSTS